MCLPRSADMMFQQQDWRPCGCFPGPCLQDMVKPMQPVCFPFRICCLSSKAGQPLPLQPSCHSITLCKGSRVLLLVQSCALPASCSVGRSHSRVQTMLQASSALPPRRPAGAAQAACIAIALPSSLCGADVPVARDVTPSGLNRLLTAPCCMPVTLPTSQANCALKPFLLQAQCCMATMGPTWRRWRATCSAMCCPQRIQPKAFPFSRSRLGAGRLALRRAKYIMHVKHFGSRALAAMPICCPWGQDQQHAVRACAPRDDVVLSVVLLSYSSDDTPSLV